MRANGTSRKWTPPWNAACLRWHSWTRPLLGGGICPNDICRAVTCLVKVPHSPSGRTCIQGFSLGLCDSTTQSKVVVRSTLLTLRTYRFARALPPRGSRDPLRSAEGGVLPYKGAIHCPGFSLRFCEISLLAVGQGLGVGFQLRGLSFVYCVWGLGWKL